MNQTAVQQKLMGYENDNAEAALIILTSPDQFQGALTEWAHMVANRLLTAYPGRYRPLERAWARTACELAYRSADPNRETMSQTDRDELSDLRAWHRR
jgi:hypothetical protein